MLRFLRRARVADAAVSPPPSRCEPLEPRELFSAVPLDAPQPHASANTSPVVVAATAPALYPIAMQLHVMGPGRVVLTWEAEDGFPPNGASYRVQRQDGAGSPFRTIATRSASQWGYTDAAVTPGVVHVYRVVAFGWDGASTTSNTQAYILHAVSIAGMGGAVEGKPYSLALDRGTLEAVDRWVIEWGDGLTEEVPGDALMVTHVFDGRSASRVGITATAYRDGVGYRAPTRHVVLTPGGVDSVAARATGTDKINIRWTEASRIPLAYRLLRSTDGQTWTHFETVEPHVRSFTDWHLDEGRRYFYRVQPVTPWREGPASRTVGATTLPEAAVRVVPFAVSPTTIGVRWLDASASERGYRIEVGVAHERLHLTEFRTAAMLPAQQGVGEAIAHIAGLSPRTTYAVRIWTLGVGGAASTLSWITCTTPPAGPLPAAASRLVAGVRSASRIDLSWRDNATDETGYRIERREGTQPWTHLAGVRADAVAFSDTTAEDGRTYEYRVIPVGRYGPGDASNVATATTSVAPPTDLRAAITPDGWIRLSWQDRSLNEQSFRIYRHWMEGNVQRRELVKYAAGWNATGEVWSPVHVPLGVPCWFTASAVAGGVESAESTPSNTVTPVEQWATASGATRGVWGTPYRLTLTKHNVPGEVTWEVSFSGSRGSRFFTGADDTLVVEHEFLPPVDGQTTALHFIEATMRADGVALLTNRIVVTYGFAS